MIFHTQLQIPVLDKIITEALGAISYLEEETTVTTQGTTESDDTQQAISNMLIDTCKEAPAQLAGSASASDSSDKLKTGYIANSTRGIAKVTSLLSFSQPQREKPSKDRGRRFAAGALVFYKEVAIDDTSVSEFQFWTLNPTSNGLTAAKIFLLGQISLVMNGSTPARSSCKTELSKATSLFIKR